GPLAICVDGHWLRDRRCDLPGLSYAAEEGSAESVEPSNNQRFSRGRIANIAFCLAVVVSLSGLGACMDDRSGGLPTPSVNGTSQASSDWPGPSNTGPTGSRELAEYEGPCSLSDDGAQIVDSVVRCD